jgi:hypothetical protein
MAKDVMLTRRRGDSVFSSDARKQIQKPGTSRRTADVEWRWRKNYRARDANRKTFLRQLPRVPDPE